MQRYRIFGFSDKEGSQVTESLLAAFHDRHIAISVAEKDPMATCVIDWETDEVIWEA
jgi:hypothetical protein